MGSKGRFDRAPAGAAATAFGDLARVAPADVVKAQAYADRLVDQLTERERLHLLSGDEPLLRGLAELLRWYNRRPIVAGAIPRLGIPGIRFSDGPRGVVMYRSTAFPVAMGRAATFDPELEERIGDAIGVEARSQGANLFAGVCINLLRHPAWGRAQETYGEDSYLLGEMGAALVRGSQRHVMACVKHFAANSMENSRFWVDVRAEDADLREIYLPHFRRVVQEGVAAVMTAYNRLNGTYCGHHRWLITEVLRGEWGFEGFVMSDFTAGIRGPRALTAGLDLEMPHRMRFRALAGMVRLGMIDRGEVTAAARRLVRTQVRFASRGEPKRYGPESVACREHQMLAREAAARSIVVLRNDPVNDVPVLPIDPERCGRIAVIGRLAGIANLGDHGSSRVSPPEVVTIVEGLRAVGETHGVDIVFDDGSDLDRAVGVAARADAVITVAGTTWREEGEWVGRSGGDRATLRLPHDHERLIVAVGAANPRHAVVLMGGSVFVLDPILDAASAWLMAWYPGMEGGTAIAEVIFGDAEPEGRLPMTWPRASTTLPPFKRMTRSIRYGPLHGYRLMAATSQRPAWWFGQGESYTTFRWGTASLEQVGVDASGRQVLTIDLSVTNVGGRRGTEVVQVYAHERLGTASEPLPTLRGVCVARKIEPGETRRVSVEVLVQRGTAVCSVGHSADPATHQSLFLEGGCE